LKTSIIQQIAKDFSIINVINVDEKIDDFRLYYDDIYYSIRDEVYVRNMRTSSNRGYSDCDCDYDFITCSNYISASHNIFIKSDIIITSVLSFFKIDSVLKKVDRKSNIVQSKPEPDHEHVNECTVCFDKITELYAIIPCGHASICHNCICTIKKNNNKCCVCRKNIDSTLRIYV
jgi:hypothetical protein